MKKILKGFGYPEVVWLPKGERSFLGFICISFILAMFVLILVGACAFLVGLLVCIPLAGLSSASLYLIFSNYFKNSEGEFQEINIIDSD